MTEAPSAPSTAASDLQDHFKLSPEQIQFYQQNGFIRLKNVLSPDTLARYTPFVQEEVDKADKTPLEDDEAYASAFIQVMNLWLRNPGCKEFAFSRRLARIAAELMQVEGVRMYHDQALFKSPGGGHTPWHCDQFYWPVVSDRTVTAWIPLGPVPGDRGPLEFAAGSHKHDLGRAKGIGGEADKEIAVAVEAGGFEVVRGGFELGEVSFHAGWTFHRADENRSNEWRKVFTVIYIDKDMVMAEPVNDNQRADWERWLPGVRPGEVCAGPHNPLLWERASNGSGGAS